MNTDELKKLLDEVTPGPWEAHVDDQGGTGRDAYVCIDGGSDVVAKAMCYTARSLNRKPYEANARLIALAPELAAEVIELREALTAVSREYDPSDGCNNAMTMHDIARAALNHKETDNGTS